MIKVETLGMLETAHVNPVLKSTAAVNNYDFLVADGTLYLIANTVDGDASYTKDVTFKAGELLNGWDLGKWVNQKLLIDGKHITYGQGKSYADLAKDDILVFDTTNKTLVVDDDAPESGIYFVITDIGLKLTEPAIKVRICVA